MRVRIKLSESEDSVHADLPSEQLKELLARALDKIAGLERVVANLRAENARLKGLKDRPANYVCFKGKV